MYQKRSTYAAIRHLQEIAWHKMSNWIARLQWSVVCAVKIPKEKQLSSPVSILILIGRAHSVQ